MQVVWRGWAVKQAQPTDSNHIATCLDIKITEPSCQLSWRTAYERIPMIRNWTLSKGWPWTHRWKGRIPCPLTARSNWSSSGSKSYKANSQPTALIMEASGIFRCRGHNSQSSCCKTLKGSKIVPLAPLLQAWEEATPYLESRVALPLELSPVPNFRISNQVGRTLTPLARSKASNFWTINQNTVHQTIKIAITSERAGYWIQARQTRADENWRFKGTCSHRVRATDWPRTWTTTRLRTAHPSLMKMSSMRIIPCLLTTISRAQSLISISSQTKTRTS